MPGHSLHDDAGLHDFKQLAATLADGRRAALEIGEDGELKIIAVWTEAEDRDPLTYPQNQVMSPEAEPDIPDFPIAEGDAPLSPEVQRMLDNTEGKAKRTPTKAEPAPSSGNSFPGNAVIMMPASDPTGANAMMVVQAQTAMSSNLAQMLTIGSFVRAGGGENRQIKADEGGVVMDVGRDPVFLARLGSVMNDNRFDRRLTGRTRGKLDMTRLYKASTGSRSVFTQKVMRRNKQYNVVMVVDQSSSMTGAPMDVASTAVQFLAQHLDRIPGVDLMVIGFASYHTVHKAFGETTSLSTLKSRVNVINKSLGGGTYDEPPLELAISSLKARPDGHNIMLYLSDGDPNNMTASRKLLRQLEQQATTVGIGIRHKVTQAKQSIRIDDLDDLKPELLKILQREITRG